MNLKLPENANDDYRYIIEELAPRILQRFVDKAGDYGSAYKLLGSKGQFSDINRKFWKLYNSVWEGRELKGEQPAECAEDIIGHCLLLILLLEREPTPLGPEFSSPERPVPPTLRAAESGRVGEDRPGADEVLEAIRLAAANQSRTGNSMDRITDAVLALYKRKELGEEHGVE